MKLSTLIPLAALLSVSAAAAEFPDVDLSRCLRMCLTMGAWVADCGSYVNTSCTCTSDAFRNTVGECLKDSCTQEDIDTAASLHKQVCGTSPQ
ncbi:uncharacterized protein N7477_000883 [Penicillium maclennaniae]|uniref:uncharacterized protein n=1 Tax=Penicillium maclennaniae TaxID=1343394 RepID=UPI0025426511|nr:uncharacterized protein N7477_000883 [Penicillium maclennaniae]KAJ5684538.1 hypothetical protein N7477_000883 [Penicillium maclennaniae]